MKKICITILYFLFCFSPEHSKAQFTKLLDFAGASNGNQPNGSLISDGTFLYGMTFKGGINDSGVIFKILPDGTGFVKLLDFDGTNGCCPWSSLFFDGTYLYGTTGGGGTNHLGVIFKILPNGSGYTKLLDFAGATNGRGSAGGLISDGTFLYGTTAGGGINNDGTIFKIKPNGTGYTKLLDFSGVTNGSFPHCNLLYDGTFLYGTTYSGGTNNKGTLFRIMPNGSSYTKLLDFTGTNGSWPHNSLISDGTFLYGTTMSGGTNSDGVIYKILPNGTGYVKLFDFLSTTTGYTPVGALFFDGTFLYGTTSSGPISSYGTIFKILPNGSGYAKLFDFNNANGAEPLDNLISDGTFLYGITYMGGINDFGTIFKFAEITGIAETTIPTEINVYPNPTSDQFYIKANTTDKLKVDMYDVNGRHVLSKSVSDKSNINVTSLNAGVYTLTIRTTNGVVNKKIVILR